jgi:hypothetical protein
MLVGRGHGAFFPTLEKVATLAVTLARQHTNAPVGAALMAEQAWKLGVCSPLSERPS